ncbi:MAG: glutamate--tRNA ligase [Alphaproteobacteria bacterium GM202ARS2]|nr:glutamate--tRNA ligase [Alphaproteobacteria bacterium GM202ARS2]
MSRPLLRFAPSPTGHLHIGNARIAVLNALYAAQNNGMMLLRIDDTDTERSQDTFIDSIQEDLRWLGIDHPEPLYQSQRHSLYQDAIDKLKSTGRLYPCFESPSELARKRKLARLQGKPPIYDRASLRLSPAEQRTLEDKGNKPYWRFKLSDTAVHWDDLVFGKHRHALKDISDPVLVRADGRPLFTLSSVVDDHALAITHIIRGEDHMTNTAAQIDLFHALDAKPPLFAHLPLILNDKGQPFAKRNTESLALHALREQGYEPLTIISLLAHLGSSRPIVAHSTWQQAARAFDMRAFSKSAPRIDADSLGTLNRQLLQHSTFTTIQPRLKSLAIDIDEAFWQVIQGNIDTLEDCREWQRICFEDKPFWDSQPDSDPAYLRLAIDALPQPPWDETTWTTWCQALATTSGRRGKTLFLPLRLALTGKAHGPEMSALLPFIGFTRAHQRLQ